MRFAVITHVNHKLAKSFYYGYAPYVREMNIWFKYVDKVSIVAPLKRESSFSKMETPYKHHKLYFKKAPIFSLISIKEIFYTIVKFPVVLFRVWKT